MHSTSVKDTCYFITHFPPVTLQSPVPSGCPLDLGDAEVLKNFSSLLEKLRQVCTACIMPHQLLIIMENH